MARFTLEQIDQINDVVVRAQAIEHNNTHYYFDDLKSVRSKDPNIKRQVLHFIYIIQGLWYLRQLHNRLGFGIKAIHKSNTRKI